MQLFYVNLGLRFLYFSRENEGEKYRKSPFSVFIDVNFEQKIQNCVHTTKKHPLSTTGKRAFLAYEII